MISVKQVSFSYSKHSIFKSLDLELEMGKIHGVLGINGAGKTTLFKLIYGMEKIDGGEIEIDEAKPDRSRIFFLETSNYFYPRVTGGEFLSLFRGENQDYSTETLQDLFNLPLDDLVDNYSTGMKKKLAIMGMLKSGRGILLMDEPFNGLDLESARILSLITRKLQAKGKTILLSSHILETLTESCDQIHVLSEGQFQKSVDRNDFEEFEKGFFKDFDASVHKKLDG